MAELHARAATACEQPASRARRVLVVGGSGLIGRALVDALRARGHQVTASSRRGGRGQLALDFSALPDAATLRAALADFEVVVNAVGVFRATANQDFDAVHVDAPLQLLDAARSAGVMRFIQLSALGADAASPLPYFASKGRFDAALLAAPAPEGVVVRPSLVFASRGASTRWFAMLAVLPLTPLPGGGNQCVQPLHVDDLAAALASLVEADPGAAPPLLNAAGPRALSLRAYLLAFKRALGVGGSFLALPVALGRWMGRLAGRWPRAPFDADALRMLDAGNTADPMPMARWRGRALRDPDDFLADDAACVRTQAWLAWLLPAMRLALLAMWITTAWVSLVAYPREDSLALLARTGLHGAWAVAALWGAALLDLALGLGLLVARWRPRVYAAQAALIAAYTVIISLALPEQWAHPYGPVLKNLPLLAMVALLWALDREPRPDPR